MACVNRLILKTSIDSGTIVKIKFVFILLPAALILVGIFLNFTENDRHIKENEETKTFKITSSSGMEDRRHPAAHLPNIIFITIEAFQADHVNNYGYKERSGHYL
jgi:restriction endonuclease